MFLASQNLLRRRKQPPWSLGFGPIQRIDKSAFTLLELLIVIGIIVVLLVALLPAVNSLSKSGGRKAGVSNLQGAIEQARAQAIKDGLATYIAFPTTLPGTPNEEMIQRYSYHSYALFEDDPANPTTPKQLTPWRTLPVGISLRSKKDTGAEQHGGIDTLPTGPTFPFQPTSNSASFPFIKFSGNGEIESPAADVLLVLFEGHVSSGTEIISGGKDPFSNPLASEALAISHLTGRAQPTATPTPTS